MGALEPLLALAGEWRATYQLRGDPSFDQDTTSSASIVPMLGGRFARIDYTWLESGNPEEGSIVIGCDRTSDVANVAWMDTWHNHDRLMLCTGSIAPDGSIDVFGATPGYPGGPDWGWRTVITPGNEAWTLTMFNVTPEGEESQAVLAEYRRA